MLKKSQIISSPLLAIPKGYNAWVSIVLVLVCSVFFIIVYAGTSFLSDYIPWRTTLYFTFENSIPFVPSASIVYLSMMLLLGFAPFILRSSEEILPLFWVLIAEISIGGLFFIFLPFDTSYPVREAQGFSGVMFDIADFVNMKRNYFPSLHVSFAFTAALFYSSKTNKAGALLFFIWASAISVSTILIHEHYLIDVIAGILLAFVCWKIIGRWAIRKEVMQASQTRLKRLYDQFS